MGAGGHRAEDKTRIQETRERWITLYQEQSPTMERVSHSCFLGDCVGEASSVPQLLHGQQALPPIKGGWDAVGKRALGAAEATSCPRQLSTEGSGRRKVEHDSHIKSQGKASATGRI